MCMKNILIVGAHPDDIELGCIATVLKLKDEGKKVFCLIMTKGENWLEKTYEERIEEQGLSFKNKSFDRIYIGEFKDGYIKRESDVIDYVSNIIKENNIDTIFCQYYEDSHQDHVNTSLVVKSASLNCDNLLYYESLTSKNFFPNFFVDVSNYENEKKEMLRCFTSQINKYSNRNQNLIEYVNSKDKLNGIKIKKNYAEGFIVDKYQL